MAGGLCLPHKQVEHVCPVTLTHPPFGQQPWVIASPTSGKNIWDVIEMEQAPDQSCCLPPKLQPVKTAMLSTATDCICQGPKRCAKEGKRNFPLTLEIGASCAAKQSNHLSYFTHCPHRLVTQRYFVFRSTIVHLEN